MAAARSSRLGVVGVRPELVVFIMAYGLTVAKALWLKFVKEPLPVVTSLAGRTA